MFGKGKKAKMTSQRKVGPLGRLWNWAGSEGGRGVLRACLTAVLVAGLVAGAVIGMRRLELRVLGGKHGAVPTRVEVVLADIPEWMPSELARQITASLSPGRPQYFDASLTREVYERATGCPWIRRVDGVVKRPGRSPQTGVLEVRAEYRRAYAQVQTESSPAAPGHVYVVDREGVRLPAHQIPRYVMPRLNADGQANGVVCFLDKGEAPLRAKIASIHYITIQGVTAPAPAVGHAWTGNDIRAGLDLIALVASRPYANQISAVDVRNHDGRISRGEPHLRMYAQIGEGGRTVIKFGRFPMPGGDYEILPQRKLEYLDLYVAKNHGLLAGVDSTLDLRCDELHVKRN